MLPAYLFRFLCYRIFMINALFRNSQNINYVVPFHWTVVFTFSEVCRNFVDMLSTLRLFTLTKFNESCVASREVEWIVNRL